MSTTKLNIINIGLMVACLSLSFWNPFLFFLFCFAFLSPLHYFSEISWLHQRQYFSLKKRDGYFLGFLGVLVFAAQWVFTDYKFTIASTVAFAFLMSLAMILTKKVLYRILAVLLIVAWMVMYSHFRWYAVVFSIFMTTVIHTCIFTGAVMVKGALQHKSASGVLSLLVFLACVTICLAVVPSQGFLGMSEYIIESYKPFWVVNSELMRLLNLPFEGFQDLYQTPGALMVMRFMAFIYSYHFMNWFSKTSLIGWHKGSKKSLAAVLFAWLACVGVFIYDYFLGITVIYFFSVVHVLMEFPLNHRTFINIGKSVKTTLLSKRQLKMADETGLN